MGGQPLLAYALRAAMAARPDELILVVAARPPGAGRIALRHDARWWRAVRGAATPSPRAWPPAAPSGWRSTTLRALWRRLQLFRARPGRRPGHRRGSPGGAAQRHHQTRRRLAGDRHSCPRRTRAVQTPQIFRRDILERALAPTDEDVTDEAALVEQLGIQVAIFAGDERAFKITTRSISPWPARCSSRA